MSVEPGELRAVIGPNGAGKTTFFNLISGFLAPTSGTILFDGQDITDCCRRGASGAGIARTFQVTEIFPELTRAREPAHRGRGRRRLSAAAVAQPRRRAQVSDARRPSSPTWAGWPTRRTGWSASCRHGDQRATEIMMALALQARGFCCSTSRPPGWAIRRPTTSPG